MPLIPSIIAQPLLGSKTREDMFSLHSRHYNAVSHARFMSDLAEKDWIILLRDETDSVVGFSTQKLISLVISGCRHLFIFSGNTIVETARRNTPLLAGCFGHLMLRLIKEHTDNRIHWFLITKGFRTYRFLPVFFNHYWPAPDIETPPEITSLLHNVARHKFGDAYDAASGIIRIPGGDRLGSAESTVPASRQQDPAIAYFLSRNPGWRNGDELACIAPVSLANLNAYAHRVIQATNPEWEC